MVRLTLGPLVLLLLLPAVFFAVSARLSDDPEVANDPSVDHAAIIRGWDEEAYERGKVIYAETCAQCHGAGGLEAPNPLATAFARDALKNGSDPYGMWRTLTEGYALMPAQTWLRPAERYDVIHYIREAFFREQNPSQYTAITEGYLESLPEPSGEETHARAGMDYGPALTYELDATRSALVLPLADGLSLFYDLHTMAVPAAWTGGFVELDESHHVEYKGGERARIEGSVLGLGPLQWAYRGSFEDPRPEEGKHGPMPEAAVRFEGHYLHGDRAVLSYSVAGRDVLDLPGAERSGDVVILTHNLRIGPGAEELVLSLGRRAGTGRAYGPEGQGSPLARAAVPARGHLFAVGRDTLVAAGVAGAPEGAAWDNDEEGRLLLRIPPADRPVLLKVFRTAGPEQALQPLARAVGEQGRIADPTVLTQGGPERWEGPIKTTGVLGEGEGAYVLDHLFVPEDNPWDSWMRVTALDFFDDGRAALSTLNGDVWIVSGIDRDLDLLEWERYATGLYEPLGLKVEGDQIYVLGRDRITRLHDLDGDGEADFFENFYAFEHVSEGYHAFLFGLHTDPEGNFYTAKSGRKTDYEHPGAVLRISPDGKKSEVVATGFRHPNGMTVAPDGAIYVSDNQGEWIPASKVSRVREGGFYGYMGWEGHEQRYRDFERPLFWLPQDVDNSSGGQVWAADPRWGPLSGAMVHTSYGAARAFYVFVQEIDGAEQGAVVPFPWGFPSGVMRARVNPKDGQVYLVGTQGWGSVAQEDASFHRIRYTGRPAHLVTDARVTPEGLALTFSTALDPSVAADPERYFVRRWNYKWSERYGSPHYHPADPEREGEEVVALEGISVGEDRHTVLLPIPDHRPVDQMAVDFDLRAADGTPLRQSVYFTINRIPEGR